MKILNNNNKQSETNPKASPSGGGWRGLKVVAWFFTGIIALFVVVLLVLQTPFAKRQIVAIAEAQAGKLLNAKLSVGQLNGNFFTHLGLDDLLLLSPEGDTIASIAHLRLRYRLLPLLKSTIQVEEVAIDSPYVYLSQLPDSTWNLAHLLKPSTDDAPDTASSGFHMQVKVDAFALNNGRARIDAFNTNIPRRVDSLYIALAGSYSEQQQWVDLNDFRLRTTRPDLQLQALHIRAEGDTTAIRLDELLLQTALNSMTAQGVYSLTATAPSQAVVKTSPVRLEEFQAFLPEDFHFKARPELDLQAGLDGKRLHATLSARDKGQAIRLQAETERLLEYLADSATQPADYRLDLRMEGIDLRHWLDKPEMNFLINGTLHAQGTGLDPHTLQAGVQADFSKLVLYDKPIDRLTLDLDYVAGDLTGAIDGQGDFGSLRLSPQVQQILSEQPRYQLQLATSRLDASALMGDTAYRTDINLTADLEGSGFSPDRLTAQGRLIMQPSSAMNIRIDTLDTDLSFADDNLQVRHLLVGALSASLLAKGNYHLTGDSELWLEAHVDSMGQINRLAGIEGLETQARINAHAQGRLEALHAELEARVLDTRFNDISADSLLLTANARLAGKDIEGEALLHAYRPAMNDLRLDSVQLQVATDTKNYRLSLDAGGQDMNARLNSFVQLGDAIQVALSGLTLGYKDYQWQQASDTAFARIGSTEYEIRDFHLTSDSDSLRQSVYIDGIVNRADTQHLQVAIDQLDVHRLLRLLDIDLPVGGLASLHLLLQGEASSPRLTGLLRVDSTSLDNLRFDTVQSNIRLIDRRLTADIAVVPRRLGRIYGEGRLPADIRLDSMTFRVVPSASDSIYARLLLDKIPLSILQSFVDLNEVAGEVNSQIEVGGVMEKPQVAGSLRLDSGVVKINPYGIDYRNIQADIAIAKDEVRIDTFLIESPDGNMTAQGGVQFQSELYNADLSDSRLDIRFNRFNPFSHKQFKMEMSGLVGLQANADSTTFSGDITIPEANIYLPAVLALMGKFSTPSMPQPLLVSELEKLTQPGDSLVYTFRPDTTASADTARSKLAFLDNLQGEVKVNIPRNTWIRNEDMRLELSGDVRLMKHRDFFELFGTIDVVRGQYNLLGKVFVIQSGTVTFQGGEDINPILNIDAVYSFRDPYRNKRDLGITVTGDLENLAIKFKLEGEEIGEGDALSYIIFGRALNELSTSESSGMDAGKLAGMAVASLVSSQLSKFGNTLNVDYIEVDVGSSFDNASLTVGKYITNKLFISYEQRIGALEDKDTARYEMTLEYELFKFLFIQLTSSPITNGFDLIFKLDSKK